MFTPESRFLIVDDMLTMRKLVSRLCRELGFKSVTEAADGNLAWDQLTKAEPAFSLVISDWNMPNCSGLELLKRVRADERFKGLPFLMVTAETEQSQVTDALLAGVSGYVVKPFSADTLKEKLGQITKPKA